MRLWRRIRRGIVVIILVLPMGALGTLLALGWSPTGRRFSSRLAEQLLSGQVVSGSISLGAIEGNLISHIVLRRVAIADSLGRPLVRAQLIEAHYNILELMQGRRLVFNDVTVDSAFIHLTQSKRQRWNYQDVFRASGGDSTATPPLVELNGLTLRRVSLRLDVPTTPKAPSRPTLRNATPAPAPRIETGPEGLVQVYTAAGLNARISRLRISTPKNDPIFVKIDSLRTRWSEPAVDIRALEGEISTAGDSLVFTKLRAALPGTVVHGAGAVRWPTGVPRFNFSLVGDTVDLKDLRWVSPDFPDWQGRGRVVAFSRNDVQTSYRLEQLRLGNGGASAVGALTAMVDRQRGLGMQGLDLQLTDVPLAVARPYLDTLPFLGTLNGQLKADGFLDTLRLGGDLVFTDALVDSFPRSRFLIDGVIHFGGTAGAVFDEFRLIASSIDLGTVRRVIPAMVLPGHLGLAGRLDGAWQNVKFSGTTEHVAPNDARSRLVGSVGLDTRDTLLAVDIDGNFDQLSFDALRTGYPSITPRGGLTGHLAARGRLDALAINAALTGEIGTVRANGIVRATSPVFGTDSLVLDFERVNADALIGKWGFTAFNGHAFLRGVVDSTGMPRGVLAMTVDPSRIGAVDFEGAQVRLHADSGLVVIDTLQADLPEGWVDVQGNLGLDKSHAGKLVIDAGFRSLAPFDSLVRARFGLSRDTILYRPLNGTVHAAFTVLGSIDDASVRGSFEARQMVLDQWHIARLGAEVRADSLGGRVLEIDADGDSLGRGTQMAERAKLLVSGRADSLRFAIEGLVTQSQIAALGTWQRQDSSGTGRLDSLALRTSGQQWRLAAPVRLALADGRPVLGDTLFLRATDGSGEITASGSLPSAVPGELVVSAVGINLRDVMTLMRRDSSTLGGIASTDFTLAGTAAAPTFRGSAAVTGPTFGDMRIPLIRAAFDYKDQRLHSQVNFWKTGEQLLQADISVPLNLAFNAQGDRKIAGDIDIKAHADSADLALLEAFTSSVRSASGLLTLDMNATGTWKNPRLSGLAQIQNGALVLPDLGVEYRNIAGGFRFTGDSMVVDSLRMNSDRGSAEVGGFVRFEQLVKPSLGLDVRFNDFLAVDIPGYMRVRPSGDLSLRGPLSRPVMTGSIALSRSELHYADFINKALIDRDDPLYADLIDTVAIRRQGIGTTFQNRFISALQIDNLHLRVNEDVWLRSNEANILLTSEGPVTVSKIGKEYQVQGDFSVARGTYSYAFGGAVTKEFKVQRGTVKFFGTTDLNAAINLEATHTLRTKDEGEIEIVAQITGELRAPQFALTSPGRSISQGDLLSLLLFQERLYKVSVNQSAAVGLLKAASNSLVSNSLNQVLGSGVQFEGLFESNRKALSYTTQLGGRASFSVSGSLCTAQKRETEGSNFLLGFGTSADYRLGGGFRIEVSRNPVQFCLAETTGTLPSSTRYQIGIGLLWKRDY